MHTCDERPALLSLDNLHDVCQCACNDYPGKLGGIIADGDGLQWVPMY